MELKQLITERGYLKGTLTRLHNYVVKDLTNLETEMMINRKSRLLECFKQYEAVNISVLALDPDDKENVEEMEDKYFAILNSLDKELNSRVATTSGNPTAPVSKLSLPSIDMPSFCGKFKEYTPFINLFNSLIGLNNSIPNVQKLYYLRCYLKDEPLELIKNLDLTSESYDKAIEILNSRYNNRVRIINEHINALLDLRPIIKSTASYLRQFICEVKQVLAALGSLEPNVRYWDVILLCILFRKLDAYTSRAFHLERNGAEDPTMDAFLAYLEKRALALENADPGSVETGQRHQPRKEQGSSASRLVTYTAAAQKPGCLFCKLNHKLYLCNKFKLLPVIKRVDFVQEKQLCNICLGGHTKKCKYHFRCNECKEAHNTLLHYDPGNSAPTSLAASNHANDVLLPTAIVKLVARDGTALHMRALLDSGSQLSFLSQKAVQLLDLKPTQVDVNVVGITNSQTRLKHCLPIEVHSLRKPYRITVTCHVVDEITCNLPQLKIDRKAIKIPKNIQLADDNFNVPAEVDILLGADVVFQVLLPSESQGVELLTPAPRNRPQHVLPSHAKLVNTQFGYIIGGSLPGSSLSGVCNKVALKCLTCDTDINSTVANFWKTENVPEVFKEQSPEQELCEHIFKNTVQLKGNRFEVALPLKLPLDAVNDALGDSFNIALKRFLNLEKKLHKNPILFSEYKKSIHNYLNSNHGHYVDIGDYDLQKEAIYFLPHHAVINPSSKTTKLRTVFDGSMKTSKKISLNDIQLNGPIVQRDLFEILLLFRFGAFAFTTDIQQMFRNIRLVPEHTSLQNILWRDSPDDTIRCIRLNTLTFGLKSSSFLATRCLKELATQNESILPLASSILQNHTYVDDVLFSDSNLDTVLRAKAQLCQLLELGGFKTHKWTSNDNRILVDVPLTEQHFDCLELQKDECSLKTLGIQLVIKDDQFRMACPEPFNNNKCTKRDILAYIGKFYDPMGFVGPIIVQAKAIMQRLWAEKTDWDSIPDDSIRQEWFLFTNNLAKMKPIFINRNISVADSDKVELIGFSDASKLAYGCCVYLRATDKKGNTRMHLLCSKSRITPLQDKGITIPRLELNAALLLSILIAKVRDTLKLKHDIDNIFLFTDSKIVLAWLRSEPIKLNAYVANRVKAISTNSAGGQWLYVSTGDNPADYISRGMSPDALSACMAWWHGPKFLHNSEYAFNVMTDLPTVVPEKKSGSAYSSSHVASTNDVFEHISRFSSIHKMVRTLAYVLRFANCLKGIKPPHKYLTSSECSNALMLLIKKEQQVFFVDEITCLKNNKVVKGSLKGLCPFIDGSGVLRVGGRLHHSNIPFSQKHQAILPKESHLVNCIIRAEHERLLHAGPKLLLCNLNQKYWITNGLSYVKKIVKKCIICFRQKATASKQLMGSLPANRVTAMSRPFETVGVDFAGPIGVKLSRVRRSLVGKGYICLFVCFATKAIHLELASDLTTDCYLACLKRFISRRGLPKEIYSDNASTFKGAQNQLTELYRLQSSQDHQSKVFQFSSKQGIRFHFIPAYSPTFGGLWEAAVKSTKYHLRRILKNQLFTYEQINTILVEIECVLNSRPLVPLSTADVNDYCYLTPGHFLIGNAITMYPEVDVTNVQQNRLKFWQLCTQLKQSFWKMWYKQYLNVLQNRPKWLNICPNFNIGSLVILREDNVPTMSWPMARVTKVFPGHDGLVRSVEVRTPNGKTHVRSISKLSILPIDN